jgi:hypothetical protein
MAATKKRPSNPKMIITALVVAVVVVGTAAAMTLTSNSADIRQNASGGACTGTTPGTCMSVQGCVWKQNYDSCGPLSQTQCAAAQGKCAWTSAKTCVSTSPAGTCVASGVIASGTPRPDLTIALSCHYKPAVEGADPNFVWSGEYLYKNDPHNSAGNYNIPHDLRLNSATDQVQVGDTLVYMVPVKASVAGHAIMTEKLDPNVDYLDGNRGCTYTASTSTVQCSIPMVVGQESSFAYRVKVKMLSGGGQRIGPGGVPIGGPTGGGGKPVGELNDVASLSMNGSTYDTCTIMMPIMGIAGIVPQPTGMIKPSGAPRPSTYMP